MVFSVPRDFRYGVLRALRDEDVDGMLEWMHDPEIAKVFSQDFLSVDKRKALAFIESSHNASDSMHFAISGDDDEYLGTVSLKGIGGVAGAAEYAIATRRHAHGTGIAMKATFDLLRIAFERLRLDTVYLYVRETNGRAIAFYRKVGFLPSPAYSGVAGEDYLWFSFHKTTFSSRFSQ